MSISKYLRKTILLAVLFLNLPSTFLFSADLKLIKVDTISKGTIDDFELVSYAQIINISTKTIRLSARNEVLELGENHTTSFCFGDSVGQCYPPITGNTYSDVYVTLAPGDTSNISDYKGFIFANDGVGVTKVKYIFYDSKDESVQVSYTAVYEVLPMSVDKELSAKVSIYPNPVSSYLKIDGVNLGVNYRIFTSIGVEVASGMLMSNLLDLSNLNTGAYTILINGNIAKEFLIQR